MAKMAFDNFSDYSEEQPPDTYENPSDPNNDPNSEPSTPCAVGYTKKWNADHTSFECVPPASSEPCPYGWARNGQGVCIELYPGGTPDGCKANQTWDVASERCIDNPATNTAATGSSNSQVPASNPAFDDLMAKYSRLFGGGGNVADPYDERAIARLEGKLKGAGEASKASRQEAYLARRSAMGLGNTGRTNQGLDTIAGDVDKNISTGMIDINDTAIRANYDNAVANINRQMAILNSQANFALAVAGNANQRQSIQNSYALQMMQLENQMEMLKLQLMAQLAG